MHGQADRATSKFKITIYDTVLIIKNIVGLDIVTK